MSERPLLNGQSDSGGGHRFNVNFSDSAYATLRDRAAARGVTMSQHLRDCIALSRWWQEQEDNGATILVELPDGRFREVVRS